MKIRNENTWSGSEAEFLASCDPDDFYDWILNEDDGHIVSYIRQGLRFQNSSDPVYLKIGRNIEKALIQIASRSKFDRIRVEKLFDIVTPAS